MGCAGQKGIGTGRAKSGLPETLTDSGSAPAAAGQADCGRSAAGAATVDGSVISVVAVAHGLDSDDVIVVSEANIIVPIDSVSYDSVLSRATLTCAFEHDRTSGAGDKGGGNIATLQGFADANYEGDFTILDDATRTTLEISQDADVAGALGNMLEPRNLTLGFAVVTVVDVDTFTIPLVDTQIPDGTVFNTLNFVTDQRIEIAADEVTATNMFGQRRGTEPTLYIIFGQENASKDRDTVNDAITACTSQNPLNLVYIPTMSFLTIACTKTNDATLAQIQKIHGEIKDAIRKSMYGFVFESADTAINFAGVEVSNGEAFWNNSHYVHSFDYQVPYRITIKQGHNNRRHVSFRDIVVNSKMFNNDGALVSLEAEPAI